MSEELKTKNKVKVRLTRIASNDKIGGEDNAARLLVP